MRPDPDGAGIPDHIGPYRIEEQIGAGGMGAVFRAYDERLDRSVAIKRILASRNPSERARRRFLREARTVARLSHPSIVQVHDLQLLGDEAWIIMELVGGATLTELLGQGPMPIDRVVELGRQIAEGLDHAHRTGVLHRDLKPENVMVTPDGHAKILDFGLSKPMVVGSSETNLTHPGALLGTLRSMSPEQARGLKLSARSDLFSLGTLLYEAISGVRPFEGAHAADSLNRVCTHQPVPLDEVVPETPRSLSELVDALLAKEPTQRPESAEVVARQLEFIGLSTRSVVPTWETPPPMPALHDTTRIAGSAPLADPPSVLSPVDKPSPDRASPAPLRSSTSARTGAEPTRPRWYPLGWAGVVGLLAIAVAVGIGRPWPTTETPTVAESPTLPTASAPELLRRGQELLRTYYIRQDLDAALATFEELLVLEPESAAAHAGMSRALWRRYYEGNRDPALAEEALRFGQQAVELDPFLSLGRISLALNLVNLRRYDEAEVQARQVLTLEPSHADGHRVLAEVRQARGQLDDAEASLRTALESRPDEADLHDLLGALLLNQDRLEEAEHEFLRSVELAPESFVGHRNLGGVFYRQGRLSDAARQLQRALEIRPSGSLYTNLGVLYFTQGLYSEATQAFEKAVGFPGGRQRADFLGNLADAYRWSSGRADEARSTYLEVIELLEPRLEAAPDSSDLRSRIAVFRAKRGDSSETRRHLALLQDAESMTATEHYRVAVAWEILGERRLALENLDRALESGASREEVDHDPEFRELRRDPRYPSS